MYAALVFSAARQPEEFLASSEDGTELFQAHWVA
jgi:hypothetical protein